MNTYESHVMTMMMMPSTSTSALVDAIELDPEQEEEQAETSFSLSSHHHHHNAATDNDDDDDNYIDIPAITTTSIHTTTASAAATPITKYHNKNSRSPSSTSTLPPTNNRLKSKSKHPAFTIWERLFYSTVARFFLLLTFCAFLGIGLPVIWTNIWSRPVDLTQESDLRYDCLPLRSSSIINEDDCCNLTSAGNDGNVVIQDCMARDTASTCIWDNVSTSNDIRCYYALEHDNDIEHRRQDGTLGKIPRYIVVQPKEYAKLNITVPIDDVEFEEIITAEAADYSYPHSSPSSSKHHNEDDDEKKKKKIFHHILQLANSAPFLSATTKNHHQSPMVEQLLSVKIHHYTVDHFSVLIKPLHEDEQLWRKNFDFNYPTTVDTTTTPNMDPNSTQEYLSDHSLAKIAVYPKDDGDDVYRDLFQLQIDRRKSGKSLFNMGLHTPFIYSRGYVEITTSLSTDLLYGLGQSNTIQFRHNFTMPKTWTLMNQYTLSGMSEKKVHSLWGSHPFYLAVDDVKHGDTYGVLLVNSFPIQVSINARPSLTLKTFGGHLELHYFLGPRPADVIRQLQRFIHYPAMPPYWALGFHACATTCSAPSAPSSYSTLLAAASIPVESDCGTALRRADDMMAFDYFKHSLEVNNRWLLSVEQPQRFAPPPPIPPQQKSSPEKLTIWQQGYSLLDGVTGKIYEGSMWKCEELARTKTAKVYYPDVFHPQIATTYQSDSQLLTPGTIADGYLLDWNTPLDLANSPPSTPIDNNNNGGDNTDNDEYDSDEELRQLEHYLQASCIVWLREHKWNRFTFAQMSQNNPCFTVKFSHGSSIKDNNNDDDQQLGSYFALHNLYGYKHTQVINTIASNSVPSRRTLIMSLSTFIGSGRFGGHIGVPLTATWRSLRLSLKQMLDFTIFGMPLSGFPVGGYRYAVPAQTQQQQQSKQASSSKQKRSPSASASASDLGQPPSDELLRRWFQLASMQPFMIAYSDFGITNLPTLLPTIKETVRSTIQSRYKLLPYLYTLFADAANTGATVAQPIFFQFPTDPKAYDITDQYMLGPALLVSPQLDNPIDGNIKVYLPPGQRWYEYYSGRMVIKEKGGTLDLPTAEQNAPLHLRGGYVIGTHYQTKQTITDMREKCGLQLIGALNRERATGKLYLDDGWQPYDHAESPAAIESMWIYFTITSHNVSIHVRDLGFCSQQQQRKTNDESGGSDGGIPPMNAIINTELTNIMIYGIIDKPYHDPITYTIVSVYSSEVDDSIIQPKKGIHDRDNDENFAAKHKLIKELAEPAVKFDNNFGVLSIDTKLDLCTQSSSIALLSDNNGKQEQEQEQNYYYFLKWTYVEWDKPIDNSSFISM